MKISENKEFLQILEIMQMRFTSGNSVPVERTSITREEWTTLLKFINATLQEQNS